MPMHPHDTDNPVNLRGVRDLAVYRSPEWRAQRWAAAAFIAGLFAGFTLLGIVAALFRL
jgi:hypothetical protein